MFPDIKTKVLESFRYKFALSLLLGVISAFAMPPVNFWAGLFIGLSGLYACLSLTTSKRQAFGAGYAFGFGYFVTGLYWIGNALLVEGSGYAWAYPLGLFGLQGCLALFYAVVGVLSYQFVNFKKLSGAIVFAFIFGGIEWVRGWIFTGFPWNLFIYTWSDALFMVQIISVANTYIVNAFFILLFIAPMGIKLSLNARWQKMMLSVGITLLLTVNCVDGYLYMYGTPVSTPSLPHIRIVQPNINQSTKWDKDKLMNHFESHLALTKAEEGRTRDNTTFIIWPETAVGSWVLQTREAITRLRETLATYENDVYLITGVLNYDPSDGTYANSLMILNKNADLVARYDKHHLVPFGEYMPFQKYLPFGPIAQFQGFKRGLGVETYDVHGTTILPLICYEAIFPGKIRNEHADLIVNVTNDAWYGDSWGPYQHLAITQFRAIENRTPVVRVANTGVSAIINPNGQIIKSVPLFEAGVINY